MPDQIRFFPLTRKELHLFQGFHCGDAPYAMAVSSWITGKAGECDECAEQALRDRQCKIYYYCNAADKVIGFGAVGTTNGEWPQPTDPRTRVAIIPWMGIHSDFHGQPNAALTRCAILIKSWRI